MKIAINDHMKLFSIQEEFNTFFPYLKLEFFTKPNKAFGSPEKMFVKHNSKTLNEFRKIHNHGKIVISPEMSVTDLEQIFLSVYGLGVQVYRKSGKAWLETTITDGWTLEVQNMQGEALSNTGINEIEHIL